MSKEDKKRAGSLESTVGIGIEEYVVITESASKKPMITTYIYRQGELIRTERADHSGQEEGGLNVPELMRAQHEKTIKTVRQEFGAMAKQASDYALELRELVRKKAYEPAFHHVKDGLALFPENLPLISYYGFLAAIVEKDLKEGLQACRQAVRSIHRDPGEESFYPMLYLNLGRVYTMHGKKAEAIECFRKGLSLEPRNPELFSEMKKFGLRKKPPISFLSRANPVNKYLGILRSYLKG